MPKVMHFEIGADDPKRAIRFYKKVFDWTIQDDQSGGMDYWLVSGGEKEPGINGAIMPRPESGEGTIITVAVKSIDACIKKVLDAGGKQVTPKTPIPGIGWFCYMMDTEGNKFGLIEPDEKAK
jgi:predicted enzyme related to lactoylglutathione lyase